MQAQRSVCDRTVLVGAATLAIFLAVSDVRFDDLKPLGGDFAQIWLAGVLVNRGDLATLYDPSAFSRAGLAVIDFFYRPNAYWSYPPTTLLVGSPLALLPYHAALLAFAAMQACLAAFTGAFLMRNRLPQRWGAAIMLSSPALLFSIIWGQLSAPVGCLLVLGVFALEKRPVLASVLFALVALKPQFGVLVPVALIAAGQWRAFAATAFATLAFVASSAIAFGPGMWIDFFAKTLPQQVHLIGDLTNYGSVAHSLRDTLLVAGLPRPVATAAQILAAIIAVWATAYTFRQTREPHVRAFVLTLGAVVVLPYANIYDAAIPAIGALALYGSEQPLRPAALAILAIIWLSPMVDALLGVNKLFAFGPLLEVLVLAFLPRFTGNGTFLARKPETPTFPAVAA